MGWSLHSAQHRAWHRAEAQSVPAATAATEPRLLATARFILESFYFAIKGIKKGAAGSPIPLEKEEKGARLRPEAWRIGRRQPVRLLLREALKVTS